MDEKNRKKTTTDGVIEALSKIFERAVDDGHIKIAALAIASGVSQSTLSRIRNREASDITFGNYVAILRHLPPDVRKRWHEVVDPNYCYQRSTISEDDLDVNGDGKVDIEDLLDAIAMMAEDGGVVQTTARHATRDHVLTSDEKINLRSVLSVLESRKNLVATLADHIATKRRKCHNSTMTLAGGAA